MGGKHIHRCLGWGRESGGPWIHTAPFPELEGVAEQRFLDPPCWALAIRGGAEDSGSRDHRGREGSRALRLPLTDGSGSIPVPVGKERPRF